MAGVFRSLCTSRLRSRAHLGEAGPQQRVQLKCHRRVGGLQYPQQEFLKQMSDSLGTPRDEKIDSYSKVAIKTQPVWLSG